MPENSMLFGGSPENIIGRSLRLGGGVYDKLPIVAQLFQ